MMFTTVMYGCVLGYIGVLCSLWDLWWSVSEPMLGLPRILTEFFMQ